LGQFRVHQKWLPRIWHQSGYRIDRLECVRFLSLVLKIIINYGLISLKT
jgi:hypothetical protein